MINRCHIARVIFWSLLGARSSLMSFNLTKSNKFLEQIVSKLAINWKLFQSVCFAITNFFLYATRVVN